MNEPLLTTELPPSLHLINKGKVRDVYKVDEETLLIVTTDRVSAFGKHVRISFVLCLLFDHEIYKPYSTIGPTPEALPNSRFNH